MRFAAMMAVLTLISYPALTGPKEDLMAADKAFSDMSVAKGQAAAFLAYLADDGRLFGAGETKPVYGKATADAFFKSPAGANGPAATNVLNWTPENADVSSDGTLGETDGRWSFIGVPDAKGNRAHATGHYMTVWRKDASGVWR